MTEHTEDLENYLRSGDRRLVIPAWNNYQASLKKIEDLQRMNETWENAAKSWEIANDSLVESIRGVLTDLLRGPVAPDREELLKTCIGLLEMVGDEVGVEPPRDEWEVFFELGGLEHNLGVYKNEQTANAVLDAVIGLSEAGEFKRGLYSTLVVDTGDPKPDYDFISRETIVEPKGQGPIGRTKEGEPIWTPGTVCPSCGSTEWKEDTGNEGQAIEWCPACEAWKCVVCDTQNSIDDDSCSTCGKCH